MIVRFYYLIFYKIKVFSKSISVWQDFEDWQSLIVISSLQGLLLIELNNWLIIADYMPIDFSNSFIAVIGMIITMTNYYIFLHKKKYKFYESLFIKMSKKESNTASLKVVTIILLVLISIIYSFVQLSKMQH